MFSNFLNHVLGKLLIGNEMATLRCTVHFYFPDHSVSRHLQIVLYQSQN